MNFVIKVRDRVRCPTCQDLRAVLTELAREGGSHFALAYDVSHAHRQIAVEPGDWGRLACQVEGTAADEMRRQLHELREAEARKGTGGGSPIGPTRVRFSESQLDETVWVNRVGTFGVGSAGYWWGRAGALLVRLSHYLAPSHLEALWLLLYADDGNAAAGGRFETALLFHLFFLGVVGTPFK